MKRILKKRASTGWTLVETMLVISILAVLASIAAPRYAAYIARAHKAQCVSNMYEMEHETYLRYTKLAPPPMPAVPGEWSDGLWRGVDYALHLALPDKALAVIAQNAGEPASLQCPEGGTYVVQEDAGDSVPVRVICSIHGELRAPRSATDSSTDQTDDSSSTGTVPTAYRTWNFQLMTAKDLAGLTMSEPTGWKLTGIGNAQRLSTSVYNNRIFMENGLDEYKVKVTGTIGSMATSAVGYGILFDAETDKNGAQKDTGYVLQFDKGYGDGALVVRRRVEGNEQNPFAVIEAGRSTDPKAKDYDPIWWNSEHVVELVVTRVDKNTKKLSIFIDGLEYGADKKITYQSKVSGESEVGLRVWGGESSFAQMEVYPV